MMCTIENTAHTECSEKGYSHALCAERIVQCAIEAHRISGPWSIERMCEHAMVGEPGRRVLNVERQNTVGIACKGEIT